MIDFILETTLIILIANTRYCCFYWCIDFIGVLSDRSIELTAEEMKQKIINWHNEQSRSFAKPTPHLRLSKEDEIKFKWASASHAAHATYIERNL